MRHTSVRQRSLRSAEIAGTCSASPAVLCFFCFVFTLRKRPTGFAFIFLFFRFFFLDSCPSRTAQSCLSRSVASPGSTRVHFFQPPSPPPSLLLFFLNIKNRKHPLDCLIFVSTTGIISTRPSRREVDDVEEHESGLVDGKPDLVLGFDAVRPRHLHLLHMWRE